MKTIRYLIWLWHNRNSTPGDLYRKYNLWVIQWNNTDFGTKEGWKTGKTAAIWINNYDRWHNHHRKAIK